jgi:hypothetical protein
MTYLGWLAWPSPRRSDGALVTYAHAFIVYGPVGQQTHRPQALCGAEQPMTVAMVNPARPHEKCSFCDERLREMGGPHPPLLKLAGPWYEPTWTFEDWEGMVV